MLCYFYLEGIHTGHQANPTGSYGMQHESLQMLMKPLQLGRESETLTLAWLQHLAPKLKPALQH